MIDYNDKLDNFHVVVIMETGVNKHDKLRDIALDLNITTTNPMKDVKNE